MDINILMGNTKLQRNTIHEALVNKALDKSKYRSKSLSIKNTKFGQKLLSDCVQLVDDCKSTI